MSTIAKFTSALFVTTYLYTRHSEPVGNSNNDSAPRRAICILESQPNEVAKGVVEFE